MRSHKLIKLFAPVITVLMITVSCTSVFPNEDLNYMWRLDKISYHNGHDFEGHECQEEDKHDIWYSFARDLVEISNSQPHGKIGITTDYGDSIRFDFSMYESITDLYVCGIWDSITTFSVEVLNSAQMILSDQNVRLYFTRW